VRLGERAQQRAVAVGGMQQPHASAGANLELPGEIAHGRHDIPRFCLTVWMPDLQVLTTCPRDCYDACGILVTVRDGAIRYVRGDPNHRVSRGKLCRKCSIGYNGVFIDPEARLTQPLRRVGGKGEGQFQPVGWDEAIAEIAGRWRELCDGPGAATIL